MLLLAQANGEAAVRDKQQQGSARDLGVDPALPYGGGWVRIPLLLQAPMVGIAPWLSAACNAHPSSKTSAT